MLRRVALMLTSFVCFVATMLAAMKASVAGHYFADGWLVVMLATSIAPLVVWLFRARQRTLATLRFSHAFYFAAFTGVVLSLPALAAVDHWVDAPLVSNRSYFKPIGSVLVLLLGYELWYLAIYRRHHKQLKSLARPGAAQRQAEQ